MRNVMDLQRGWALTLQPYRRTVTHGRKSLIPSDRFLLLIGAMKCGTSTLFRHLAGHPEIAPSSIKEPEYFSEYQGHRTDPGDYSDLWQFDPLRHRYALEASTGYTKFPLEPHVPDRIKEAGLNPRFIYAVRDPIRRMESHFNHGHLGDHSWAPESFFDPVLLYFSSYYMQLQQFLIRFPDREKYLIVDFDELVSAPQDLVNRIYDWLGLDSHPIGAPVHRNRTPDESSVERFLRDRNLTGLTALLPSAARKKAKSWLRARASVQLRMTPSEEARVRKHLERDIRLFGESFDFPIHKWGF